jgi:hypothetical protein
MLVWSCETSDGKLKEIMNWVLTEKTEKEDQEEVGM